jgi:hypothetical protein
MKTERGCSTSAADYEARIGGNLSRCLQLQEQSHALAPWHLKKITLLLSCPARQAAQPVAPAAHPARLHFTPIAT